MKLSHYILIVMMMIMTVFTSCTTDGFIIGEDYLDKNLRAIIIDTCTVKMTTVPIEDLVTSEKSLVLAGSFDNPYTGKLRCEAFMAYEAPASRTFPSVPIYFDSLEVLLVPNGTWIGDTTVKQTFNLHRLTERIIFPDEGEFYNHDSVLYEETPYASVSFKPRPNDTTRRVAFRLPDEMGIELLNLIMDDDETIIGSNERFMNYFHGFALVPGEDNNTILGFEVADSCLGMRLHYHYSQPMRTTAVIDIPVLKESGSNGYEYSFYNVRTDRSGTPFADFKTDEIPSDETGNMVLVQPLTASYVKFEFPYLDNLLKLGDFCTILNASLLMYPVKNSYSDIMPLPESVSMYISNENDVSTGAIYNYSGDALQTGDLSIDRQFYKNTYYTFDITSYLSAQLGVINVDKRNLQMVIPQSDIALSLNSIVAGNDAYETDRPTLKITILVYDNN